MNPRWLILADDLTGAADAAVAFARRGHDTEVTWGENATTHVAVRALDLDSRASRDAEAATRHRDALRRALEPGRQLFKKIDSTLRGQPAAEIAAISATLREQGKPCWGLLAPANPAMRRTTRDGRVLVDGRPLELSDTWKREHTYPDADLARLVESVGLAAVKLPLPLVRGDAAALRATLLETSARSPAGGVMVCDSETDDDLARLVAAARDAAAPGFFIGTAGLANALADSTPPAARRAIALDATSRGTLVAVGTMAEVSREAARRLAGREGKGIVRIEPAGPYPGGPVQALFAMSIAARLIRGETAVALLEAPDAADGGPNARYAGFFAEALAMALNQMGALIVTGGETAAALLAQCRVRGIRLFDEIEPGIALGMTQGDVTVPIITKPGAFGDEECLLRCLDKLNQLRRTA